MNLNRSILLPFKQHTYYSNTLEFVFYVLQGHGYKSQVSAHRVSTAPSYDGGSHSQRTSYQEEQVYPPRYSSQGQEASTLPYGTTPPHASSHSTQAATLDYGAKPPVAAKPDKDKKKHSSFFGGVFSKNKKDKEKDAKK